MSSLEQLRCDSQSPSTVAGSLLPALERGNWVRLLGPQDVLLEAPKAISLLHSLSKLFNLRLSQPEAPEAIS